MAHIHLIVPTVTEFNSLPLVEPLKQFGLTFSQSFITNGPASIESEFDELLAAPDVVLRAMEAEANGAEAAIVLCMGNPGVAQAREAVKIPVLGPGETAMHHAAMLGHKFSVIPTLARRRPTYEHHARHYGLESRLASVRPADVPVLEIEQNPKVFDVLLERARAAVEQDHADVLILGCIGFSGLDRRLEGALRERGHDVPVIDALPLTVLTAATLVRSGLRHAKNAYPYPPEKIYKGYEFPKRKE